jgi:hypothetical protein
MRPRIAGRFLFAARETFSSLEFVSDFVLPGFGFPPDG